MVLEWQTWTHTMSRRSERFIISYSDHKFNSIVILIYFGLHLTVSLIAEDNTNTTFSVNILESEEKKDDYCLESSDERSCRCKPGFVSDQGRCRPVCAKGCMHGNCASPNKCDCHFGFVGENCSSQCDCNGHSNCASESQLSTCIECYNNTQGTALHNFYTCSCNSFLDRFPMSKM